MINSKFKNIIFLIVSAYLLYPMFVYADASPKSIRVIGRKSGLVSRSDLTVADIAKVYSKNVADDEAVLAINKISLGQSPAPGNSITITASQVIERMREEGVNVDKIGYAIPRVITIERASRSISFKEIEAAIKDAASNIEGQEFEIRSIDYNKEVKVAPGKLSLLAKIVPATRSGKYTAQIEAEVKGEELLRFSVPLTVKEWVELPVAKRSLPRGALITADDLVMARADIAALDAEVARGSEQIVGYATKQPIGHGEAFNRKKLLIPPVIENGSRVILRYKTSLLEATSPGTALEDGTTGQQIRVRNEGSKRVVTGTVVEPGLVSVN